MILPEYSRHVHEKGVYGNVVDGSMSGDDVTGIVRIFCDSRRVENWPEAEIKAGALEFLKRLFPSEEQARLIDDCLEIIVWDWNKAKPSLPGVTFTFPPSGVLSTYGHAMTRPHGRIHWGGSERSVWGSGWMEGAIERGNDVAQEILLSAKWVQPGYNVRSAHLSATASAVHGLDKGLARPSLSVSSFHNISSDPASDDELSADEDFSSDSEVDEMSSEWTPIMEDESVAPLRKSKASSVTPPASSGAHKSFVPRSRLDLAAHLFTDDQRRAMSHKQQLAHLGRIEPPAHSSPRHWISPRDCLAALKEIHDIKIQRSGATACSTNSLLGCSKRSATSSEAKDAKESGCVLC
jgi:hypothetical protein